MAAEGDRARWARVGELFHRALETPDADRERLLDDACGADEALRRDVASLLAAHARENAALDLPSMNAATLLAADAVRTLVGQRIGPYEILDVAGHGGMGVVYRARDSRLGRDVALKALPAHAGDDTRRRERLRREARAAAALSHPNIAVVYALEEIDGRVYVASELVTGRTLRDELAAGPLPLARARETLLAIARAVAAAHDQGIVHRDLKPENVMRTTSGTIKVLDFGLAQIRSEESATRLTDDGAVLGTPAYMAPEQLRGEPSDARADVFALGVLAYELIGGRTPFDGGHGAAIVARVLESDPAALPPPAGATGVQQAGWEAFTRVVWRCLRKAPAERYATAGEIVAALETGDAGHPTVPSDPSGTPAAHWWWRFHLSAASAGHALLLVPLWFAGQAVPDYGLLAFLAGLAGAIGGSLLRLHLLFAERSYPAEAGAQRETTRPWIRGADLALVAACVAAGLLVRGLDAGLGSVLVGLAVLVLLLSLIVEPATTRAAFPGRQAP